uniref:Uncharacterized protein n=1 Tax=Mucochytrium quahogii TaxID=96639 RepID=A0A7S2WH17_9STRA|mmetsp:Transcript_22860/g.49794  ORF Transcript_22860/g.49794 Transcript_22860/m.49794 type:complete len:131 (+) Transcript_22860:207-599(+)
MAAAKQPTLELAFQFPRTRDLSLQRFRQKRVRRTYNRRVYKSMARPQKKGPQNYKRKPKQTKSETQQTQHKKVNSIAMGNQASNGTEVGSINKANEVETYKVDRKLELETLPLIMPHIVDSEWLELAGML